MRSLILCLFLWFTGTAIAAEPKVLHVYVWYDFLPQKIISQFEEKTGISVIVDYYDSNQTLEANLLTKSSGYDLVFPTAWPYLYRQIQKKLYKPLDKTKLSNWRHLDKDLLVRLSKADPENRYAAPYVWGLTGIGYNKKMVESILPNTPVDSWAILFDPTVVSKLAKKGVYLLDDATDVFAAALVYLGHPPYSQDKTHINEAFELLKKVRPYIKRFDSYRAMSDLANGEAVVAQNWSGDVAISRQRAWEARNSVDIGFGIPKEGTAFWMDAVAIPIDAPHPDNAHLFLNYLMEPEVMAEITNEMLYANGNRSSLPYIRPELLNDPAVYPPRELVEKAYVDESYDPTYQREMNRLLLKLIMHR